MKILQTLAVLLFSFTAFCQNNTLEDFKRIECQNGQFEINQIGNVIFNIAPNAKDTNSILMRRRTANIINEYVKNKKIKKNPLIKLEIIEQDSLKKYGQDIKVYYVKTEDVFFPSSLNFGIVNKPYFVISLILYENFELNGLNATKYLVKNYRKIKQRSKIIGRKIRYGIETDEDMESLTLPLAQGIH